MLDGQVAVVTGGGQGIGKYAAKSLAEAGVKIVIADLNYDTAKITASELSEISEKLIKIKKKSIYKSLQY